MMHGLLMEDFPVRALAQSDVNYLMRGPAWQLPPASLPKHPALNFTQPSIALG